MFNRELKWKVASQGREIREVLAALRDLRLDNSNVNEKADYALAQISGGVYDYQTISVGDSLTHRIEQLEQKLAALMTNLNREFVELDPCPAALTVRFK